MYFFQQLLHSGEEQKYALIIFSGQLEGKPLDYSYTLEKELEKITPKPEEIIFIYPKYIEDSINQIFLVGEKPYENLVRFGEDIPVALLSFNGSGDLEQGNMFGQSKLMSNLDTLKIQIVSLGLFNLANRRKKQVILRAPSGSVFCKPSGQKFEEFIKASELAVGHSETQFVAFCLLSSLPKNRDIRKIYIDTNSISSYIEALLFYRNRFFGNICKQATYQSFSSYDGRKEAKPDYVKDVWVVISASSSNSLGMVIAREWSLDHDQVLTILSYQNSMEENIGDKTLVNISELSLCLKEEHENGSLIQVKMVGENFTAEVEKPNPINIRSRHKTQAINGWIFLNKSNSLIECNKAPRANLPPSPVYINCYDYFKKDTLFKAWLKNVVDWYVPWNTKWIVFRGIDSASEQLADEIELLLRRRGMNLERIDIEDAQCDISGEDSVVVAIPVTGSGETLLKLNRNLRISGHKGNRIFISPFAVSPSKAKFEHFKKSLIYAPNNLEYIFVALNIVYIGHSESNNSWQRELNIVEQLDSPFWRARADRLNSVQLGLQGYIGTPSLSEPGKLEFTQDFAFWPKMYNPAEINPEAVYLTISSILQGLRDKPFRDNDPDSLYSYVYRHSVISPENFSRFTDSLLQSCLWRAADSRELDYRSSPELCSDFSGILMRLVRENAGGENNAAIDLLMGLAIGKIRLSNQAFKELLLFSRDEYTDKNEDALILVKFMLIKYFPEDFPPSEETLAL